MKKKLMFVLVILCFALFSCGKSTAEKEKVDVKNAISHTVINNDFGMIPTGIEIETRDQIPFQPSFAQKHSIDMILCKFQKEKMEKIIFYRYEVFGSKVYISTINQPIELPDTTTRTLISQNKQLKAELQKLQNMLAGIQKRVKKNSIKLDSIREWLYKE